MSLWSRLFFRSKPDTATESRSLMSTLASPAAWLLNWFTGGEGKTASGKTVSIQSAMTLSAVYSAVRIISETVAMLPIGVFQEQPNGDRTAMKQHPAYRLLQVSPNPLMTVFTFRELMTARLLLQGNAFAEIERNGLGDPVHLWPIDPERVQLWVYKNDQGHYEIWYQVRQNREIPFDQQDTHWVPGRDMLHFVGPGDGLVGCSVLKHARESLGLGLAVQDYGASYFGSGGKPSGIVTTPRVLSDKEYADVVNRFGQQTGAATKLIDGDIKYIPITVPPEDSQFLDSHAKTVIEVCRWFRIQPHKLAELERSTNNNIEEQNREFVQDTIAPWCYRQQAEYKRKLFTAAEQLDHCIEHDTDECVVADMKGRFEAWNLAKTGGWMNTNEIRRRENLNSIGPEGEVYWVPLNMVNPAAVQTDLPTKTAADPAAADVQRSDQLTLVELRALVAGQQAFFRSALASTVEKLKHKLRAELLDAAGKPERFLVWIDRQKAELEARWLTELKPYIVGGCAAGLPRTAETELKEFCTRAAEAWDALASTASAQVLPDRAKETWQQLESWLPSICA